MTAETTIPVRRIAPDAVTTGDRRIAAEVPVALEYNGIGYAVMMATPENLADFATGFTLSEQLAITPDAIRAIDVHETGNGQIIRITLTGPGADCIAERARSRVSESGCGLCGVESLAQAVRPLPPVTSRITVETSALFAALTALDDHQPLNRATGAAHAAAFCAPDGAILAAREDVGRHNAFDKLIGHCARSGIAIANGFVLLSSRCSYELVQKAVIANCPMLVTISAPTSLAVETAQAHGLRLIVLARPDSMLEIV